jgi:hypothetical protein
MPDMLLKPHWLRVNFQSSLAADSVDRTANVLRGYVVAQEGPFKSAGRGEFNKEGLQKLVALGNAKPKGLKSRFTHPDMSSDGLGKFLGRAKNHRMATAIDARTGKRVNAVRADLHFDKTAMEAPPQGGGKPLGTYIMDLAESDPDAFSTSIVVVPEETHRLNKDGTPQTDEEGNQLPPLWMPVELHASDFVDTGDAVDSALGAGVDVDGLPLAALWRGEELLDSVFAGQPRDVIEARLSGYVQRYLDRKFGAADTAVKILKQIEEKLLARPKLDAKRLRLEEMDLESKRLLTSSERSQ